jgi:hypothetical protein
LPLDLELLYLWVIFFNDLIDEVNWAIESGKLVYLLENNPDKTNTVFSLKYKLLVKCIVQEARKRIILTGQKL